EREIGVLHAELLAAAPGAHLPGVTERGARIDEVAMRAQALLDRGLAGPRHDARPALGHRVDALRVAGGGVEDVGGAVAELELCLRARRERANKQDRQDKLLRDHSAVMSVPAPCSVKSSSRRTWGMRPSRMTAALTPDCTASIAVSI